jgi:hypothetical protein
MPSGRLPADLRRDAEPGADQGLGFPMRLSIPSAAQSGV